MSARLNKNYDGKSNERKLYDWQDFNQLSEATLNGNQKKNYDFNGLYGCDPHKRNHIDGRQVSPAREIYRVNCNRNARKLSLLLASAAN